MPAFSDRQRICGELLDVADEVEHPEFAGRDDCDDGGVERPLQWLTAAQSLHIRNGTLPTVS